MKKIYKILLLILGLLFVAAASLFLISIKTMKAPAFMFSPAEAEYKAKEIITTSIILRGPEPVLKEVAVIDIKIEYDQTKLKLVSAEPGQFFPNPMKVKWDEENAVFSLAILPSEKNNIVLNSQKEGEIIKLVFQAMESTGKTKIGFAKVTSAYLLKKGKMETRFSDAVYVIVE